MAPFNPSQCGPPIWRSLFRHSGIHGIGKSLYVKDQSLNYSSRSVIGWHMAAQSHMLKATPMLINFVSSTKWRLVRAKFDSLSSSLTVDIGLEYLHASNVIHGDLRGVSTFYTAMLIAPVYTYVLGQCVNNC